MIGAVCQALIIVLTPWALMQWNKWRGVKLTAQEKVDQDRAITTAVLSIEQDAIKQFKETGSLMPGPDKLLSAIERAKGLEPVAVTKLSEAELEMRVEANVALLGSGSIRPPGYSVRPQRITTSMLPPKLE